MNISTTLPLIRRRHGISLFELLLSVALIGIMCSLALPIFGAQQDVFSSIKAKRNAQELVTEFAVARAAGVDFMVAGDLDATLANLKSGARATSGVFEGRTFGIPGMSDGEISVSKAFLKLQNGDLMIR